MDEVQFTTDLAQWEVEEFVEQLELRKRWVGKDKCWIRTLDGVNQYALRFKNGLPLNMSSLSVVLLSDKDRESVLRHVRFLLSKFTSYTWRKNVEKLLRSEQIPPDRAQVLALKICSPDLSFEVFEEPVSKPVPPRSRLLRNLLKGGSR